MQFLGKTIYAFGDNLIAGHNFKNGYLEYVAYVQGMKLENYTQNATTIMNLSDYDGQISAQLSDASVA